MPREPREAAIRRKAISIYWTRKVSVGVNRSVGGRDFVLCLMSETSNTYLCNNNSLVMDMCDVLRVEVKSSVRNLGICVHI